MGEHADDYIDGMLGDADYTEEYETICSDSVWYEKVDPLLFRNGVHITADRRHIRIGEMESDHLVNALLKRERDYITEHGLEFARSKEDTVRSILYRTRPKYRAMQKELALRKLIWQHHINHDPVREAIQDILAIPNQALKTSLPRGTITGRFNSTQANVSNPPKSKPKQPEYSMQHKNIISIIQQDFFTVGVKFDGTSQIYTYKVPNSVKLEKDDHVVTRRAGTKAGYGVAKVVRIDEVPQIDLDAPYEYAWIVQRVDATGYDAQLELEDTLKKELHQVEVAHQRHTLVEKMSKHLEPDSPAKKLFDSIVERSKQVLVGSAVAQAQDTLPSSVDNGQA